MYTIISSRLGPFCMTCAHVAIGHCLCGNKNKNDMSCTTSLHWFHDSYVFGAVVKKQSLSLLEAQAVLQSV